MKSPLCMVLWVCLWFGAAPGTHAEPASSLIARIYQAALDNTPQMRARDQRMAALDAARRDARQLTAGPLTLEGTYRSDRNFDNQGLRETEIGVSAPLWLWNERIRTQEFRQAQYLAAEARLLEQQLELAGQVRNAIWNTLAAQVEVDIVQARQLAATKLLQDVDRRVNAGDLAKADFLQASALHAQTQAELVRAQAALLLVGTEFTALTGLPVSMLNADQHGPALEGLPKNLSLYPQNERQIEPQPELQLDLQTHPVYLALQNELAAVQSRAALLGTQGRANPELGLALVNERGAFAAPNEKSLVVTTRIPLGSSEEHESRLLEANADVIETQQRLMRAETNLKAQASAALANLQFFDKLQANAQEQARLARQVHTMYEKSFSLGETDFPTLMRFEQQAFEAERMARKSILEYSAKVSALRQALGLLPGQAS